MTGLAAPVIEQIESLLAAHPNGLLPVVTAGEPVLARPALALRAPLPPKLLEDLVAAMFATMEAAPGVGLAAPQIGIPLALAVVADPATVSPEVAQTRERFPLPRQVLTNPTCRVVDPQIVSFYEGCLSIPGYAAVRGRARAVELTTVDPDGRAETRHLQGWAARIAQHETDHLHGVLFLEGAVARSVTATEHNQWLNEPTPATAARELGFDVSGT